MPAKSSRLIESQVQEKPRRRPVDSPTLLIVLMLMATGLIALFTASYSNALYQHGDPLFFIKRQAGFAVAGLALMWFVSGIHYRVYARFHKVLLFVSYALLAVTPFIGRSSKGATRWIEFGPIGFQPSEVMKVAVIISFAYYISKNPASVRTLTGLIWPYGAMLVSVAGLLVLEPHMSATMIIFLIGGVMLFVGGMRLWVFLIPIIGGPLAFIAYLKAKPYAMDRIRVWLDPFIDLHGDGWQGANSQVAIGSGGLFGLGLGNGRQKHLYLPEPQNDFVFSAFCEELGLIGAILVMLLFAYLIFRGFYIARSSRDKFGCLLATGITAKLAIQTLMNLCVITGIFPVTGASLPFFSYGGTALLMQLAEIGILLNISRFMTVDNTG